MYPNLLTAAAFALAATMAQAGCGPDTAACQIEGGEYHIALPDQPTGAPVVVFLHGAGSHGGNVMRNKSLVNSMVDRGYAVLAPTALSRPGGRISGVWNFYPGWGGRDEPAFLRDVISSATKKFGINPTTVLLSGFSAGGFMVSYLACSAPDTFAAYAPVSGGFWRPHPDTCQGPVRLFQTHGWRDKTVPLEGRPLRSGQFVQGDIFAGMEIWRRANGCPNMSPDEYSETGVFWRRKWTDCKRESALEFALFPGGHTVPDGWSTMVLDWFEDVTTTN
jgi:polyhydroxybutyrate depolymerase